MKQVITTTLLDGDPKGPKLVEVANWSGKAFVVPRVKLKELKDRDDIQQPGLYFLFNKQEDSPSVYIGQSENIFDRLFSHDSSREEDEWVTAVVFVGNLDSTFIKYLEKVSLSLTKETGRYNILNKSEPRENKLSESQTITASKYFEQVKMIIGFFGYLIFEDPKPRKEKTVYYCEASNKEAKGKGNFLETGEFIVFKDSRARVYEANSFKKHVKSGVNLRRQLQSEGVLKKIEKNDKSFIFTRDYTFTSPSAASDVVTGEATNGWTKWKDEKGNTLDENIRK